MVIPEDGARKQGKTPQAGLQSSRPSCAPRTAGIAGRPPDWLQDFFVALSVVTRRPTDRGLTGPGWPRTPRTGAIKTRDFKQWEYTRLHTARTGPRPGPDRGALAQASRSDTFGDSGLGPVRYGPPWGGVL